MPNDENIKVETNTELKSSYFVPRQCCQNLSAEQHAENRKKQKINILNEKKKTCNDIKNQDQIFN